MKGIDVSNLVELGSVIATNPDSVGKHFSHKQIEYVDISSVGTGMITETTSIPLAQAPSRAKRLVRHGDTILAAVRPNLRSFVYIKNPAENIVISTGFVVLRPSTSIHSRFLYYMISHQSFTDYLVNNAKGAAYPAVDSETFRKAKIYLPPLPIQRKIAAILSAYDDLIENNTRRIALLEKMAEEVYREWFVRLRFPGHEGAAVHGGAPEGWEVKRLPEIAAITYGFPFDGKLFSTEPVGTPIIRIRNIPDSSTSDYTMQEADKKYIIRCGDLVVGMDGEFHINHWFGDDAYLVQRVCRIKAMDPVLDGYLAQAIVAPVKYFESILMGATVGHLGAKDLNVIDILIPCREFQKHLDFFNTLLRQKIRLQRDNKNLKSTRDLLLSRLLSGKLDVEELDIGFPPGMDGVGDDDGKGA